MPTQRTPTGGQKDQGGRQTSDTSDQNRNRKQTSGSGDKTSKSGMPGSNTQQKSSGKRGQDEER